MLNILWLASMLSQLGLIARMMNTCTYRSCTALFCYVSCSIIRTAVLLPLDPHTWTYAKWWGWTEPVLIILRVLLALSLMRDLLKVYRGSERFVTCLLAVSVGIGLAACYAALPFELRLIRWDIPHWVPLVLLVKRIALFSFAAALSVAWIGTQLMPADMSRNMRTNLSVGTLYFALLGITNATHYWTPMLWLQYVLLAASAICYVAWTLRLSKDGDSVRPPSMTSEDLDAVERAAMSMVAGLRELTRRLLAGMLPPWLLTAVGLTTGTD